MSRRRAVITGIGPVTCVGKGREDFWNGILSQKSGVGSITSFDPGVFRVRCAGEIADWNAEDFFSPQRLKRLDRYAQFAVVSARLALDDARIECSRENPQDRVGVSFGTAFNRRSLFKCLVVQRTQISLLSLVFAAWAQQIQIVVPVARYRWAKRCDTFETILRT